MEIKTIIKEEFSKLIFEYDDDVDWDLYEKSDEIKMRIFFDFLYNNNEDYTKRIPWTVIPFYLIKRTWEDFIKFGEVKNQKALDKIEGIVSRNIMKVNILTELSGHSTYSPDEDFEENFSGYIDNYLECRHKEPVDPNQLEINFDNPKQGHKKKEIEHDPCPRFQNNFFDNLIEENGWDELGQNEVRGLLFEKLREQFDWYYTVDSKGRDILSDYGLQPLLKLLIELRRERLPEKKLVTIDKILNVVHQRSDIAAWFIEGGTSSLGKLSGYIDDEGDSTISGEYKMSDYR
jgi:hypothetical protein